MSDAEHGQDGMQGWTFPTIIESLERCRYTCEAGPLENNTAYISLKAVGTRIEAPERVAEAAKEMTRAAALGDLWGSYRYLSAQRYFVDTVKALEAMTDET